MERFLTELVQGVPATKEIEMIVLELLLHPQAEGNGIVHQSAKVLVELEQSLKCVKLLVLYFAFVKPTATKKYAKCFQLLDAVCWMPFEAKTSSP